MTAGGQESRPQLVLHRLEKSFFEETILMETSGQDTPAAARQMPQLFWT
jgi:hypothetical protein